MWFGFKTWSFNSRRSGIEKMKIQDLWSTFKFLQQTGSERIWHYRIWRKWQRDSDVHSLKLQQRLALSLMRRSSFSSMKFSNSNKQDNNKSTHPQITKNTKPNVLHACCCNLTNISNKQILTINFLGHIFLSIHRTNSEWVIKWQIESSEESEEKTQNIWLRFYLFSFSLTTTTSRSRQIWLYLHFKIKMFVVKVRFGSDLRRFSVPETISFSSFVNILGTLFPHNGDFLQTYNIKVRCLYFCRVSVSLLQTEMTKSEFLPLSFRRSLISKFECSIMMMKETWSLWVLTTN